MDKDDLVERLLRSRPRHAFYKDDSREPINPDGPEAADRIQSLQAENAALRDRVEILEGQQLSVLGAWYNFERVAVARICDEVLDRSGALLGRVREHAKEARTLLEKTNEAE